MVIGRDTKLLRYQRLCRRNAVGEVYGRIQAHSETQPSWLLPTSVGFATSAHAKCAFIVLKRFSGTFRLLENQVGTPADDTYCRQLE